MPLRSCANFKSQQKDMREGRGRTSYFRECSFRHLQSRDLSSKFDGNVGSVAINSQPCGVNIRFFEFIIFLCLEYHLMKYDGTSGQLPSRDYFKLLLCGRSGTTYKWFPFWRFIRRSYRKEYMRHNFIVILNIYVISWFTKHCWKRPTVLV